MTHVYCSTVSQAFKLFMSAEYSQIWTAVCNQYGVSHSNQIPKRSQTQGGCEISIKLFKQGSARICQVKKRADKVGQTYYQS